MISTLFVYSLILTVVLLLQWLIVRFITHNGDAVPRAVLTGGVLLAVAISFIPLVRASLMDDAALSTLMESTSTTIGMSHSAIVPAMRSRLWSTVCAVYAVGATAFFAMLLTTLCRIALIVAKSERTSGVIRLCGRADMPSFTWGVWIVINREDYGSDTQMLLTHELEHCHRKHWLDLLLLNFVGVITWYAPFALWLRRELAVTHEAEADKAVINKGFDMTEYQMYLVGKASGRSFFAQTVICGITTNSIKRRIMIMQHKNKKKCHWLPIFAVIVIAMASFMISPAMPVNTIRELLMDTPITITDSIVKQPDTDAMFTGGEEALYSFLARNIYYPVECAQKDIQGNVEVSFIVRPDGSIADAMVAKSVHPLLDAEAVRVVSKQPKYVPATCKGAPVAVKKSLTITFTIR